MKPFTTYRTAYEASRYGTIKPGDMYIGTSGPAYFTIPWKPFPFPPPPQVYLIGSLRNSRVPVLGNKMRKAGINVFDDWYAAGPEADDCWQAYEKERGRPMAEALKGEHALDVFAFDKRNLDASYSAVLVLPAGKSGHLELGYMAGKGKATYILLDGEPDRFDVMYNFATGVFTDEDKLIEVLKNG